MSTKRKPGSIFGMSFNGEEDKKAYVEMMSRINQIDEKDQPLLGGQRPGRFSIKFETPEQEAAYIKMMSNANKIHNDGSKIGGEELIRTRR